MTETETASPSSQTNLAPSSPAQPHSQVAARPGPKEELSEQTKGMYAIGLALVVGLAILLGTLWIANQNFNTALSQWPAGGAGAAAGANAGGSGAGAGAGSNAGTQPNPPAALPSINLATLPYRGTAGAPVTIFEIADFQCPYCVQAYPIMEQVREKYNGSIRLIFIHFPLPQHPLAEKAAEAAECAYRQKPAAFWQFHDWIFE
ncbi:MAG: DsbA family protein, partial [Candidatus Marsarchaeota archaeon]|nr:DsbA family protein [Candidatus Marsarchaeota archaeon]